MIDLELKGAEHRNIILNWYIIH